VYANVNEQVGREANRTRGKRKNERERTKGVVVRESKRKREKE